MGRAQSNVLDVLEFRRSNDRDNDINFLLNQLRKTECNDVKTSEAVIASWI